ncbi:MAG: hypothetical protein ACRD3N_13660 [Terracidiphilus sp.]
MKTAPPLLVIVAAAAMAAASLGFPQSAAKPPAAVTRGKDSAQLEQLQPEAVPTIPIEFKPQGAIPGVMALPAISMPILCSPDGTPFISAPEPPTYIEQSVFSLSPKGGHTFSYGSQAGLYDVRFVSFFPGGSIVGVLVNATKDPKQSSYTVESASGAVTHSGTGFSGEHNYYIAEFDRDGNYKATVELPAGYSYRHFAELADGKLLATAYDEANAVARLLLLDSSGQIIRRLEVPEAMEDSPALRQGETGGGLNQARAASSLSWWLFASVRDKVILYQAHSNAPVLEVGAGGYVRQIPLQAPSGYELDGMISASDLWIVRFRRKDLPADRPIDLRPEAKNYVLYEVNPGDGSLESELDVSSGPAFGIACEQDGVLTGFSRSPDSKFIRLTADVPK